MKYINVRTSLLALVVMVVLGFFCKPCHAQSTGAPAFSVKRLSVGAGADFTSYRPSLLGDTRQEFRGVLPVSYNLGVHSSVTFRGTYGFTSHQKEWSAGIVLHLLARGKTP